MNSPDIESIEKRLKRGTGYRKMQETALSLCERIKELEELNLAHGYTIKHLEEELLTLESDRDLMIKKFDEDFENAIDFHLEKEAKKRRENKDTGWSGPSWR